MQASSEASITQECASQVELRIHCKNLINKDTTSKSDPCAVLYIYEQDRWNELARTENIKNCLDPQFATPLSVKYYFEVVQKIKIAVYDVDNKTETLSDDDFLGQFECTLGQLVSNSPLTKKLLNKKGKEFEKSLITVTAEELSNKNEMVHLSICAKKLDNKDFLGKSDPFLEFSKKNTDGSSQVVHRTEVIKNNLNPTWHPFSLTTQALCNNDKSRPIQIDCYDWDSDGSHDLIGSCTMTLAEMMEAGSGSEVEKPCVNPKKKKANSGHIIVQTCKVAVIPSFLNYVMGGMQINFTVGIDFTGSNGDPADPRSLHHISPDAPNQYMQAIQAVGTVCQDYDTDKFFPALGFGAKIPPNMELSHEFAVNFNFQNPFCAGVAGILEAYQNCIRQVQLWGPTNIAPIINHVTRFARTAQAEESTKGAAAYFILLLLTDGVVTDMAETVEAIVEASRLPMSLIIVGIGNADFKNMDFLDGDDGVLTSKSGKVSQRDIVQFVPFNKFVRSSMPELARHVLAEVPQQVVNYFQMMKISPNHPPVPAS